MVACVRSKTAEEYVPEVTPSGSPGNAGTAVATGALVPSGAQQWMCAAVSLEVKPLNVTLIWIVWAVGSSTTVARPVPGETTAGTSFAPLRLPTKVSGTAWAADIDIVCADATARAATRSVGTIERDRFMTTSTTSTFGDSRLMIARQRARCRLEVGGRSGSASGRPGRSVSPG